MNFVLSSRLVLALCVVISGNWSSAQFAGPVGSPTTTAVSKDSSIIVAWANNCQVQRGYKNIADTSLGYASTGLEIEALSMADITGIVSLGDSGVAVISFVHPIYNGPGPDFVIFENAFNDSFLELGHVEVSSDGINFHRFPSSSYTQTSVQIGPFDQAGNAEKLNNLAGKYRGGYGTPFDLQELSMILSLNVDQITHIKIVDVVGSIDPSYGTEDQNGNFINDPFPTPFESSGFDLDAVGACYLHFINDLPEYSEEAVNVYPNPVIDELKVGLPHERLNKLELFNIKGELLLSHNSNQFSLSGYPTGIYYLKVYLNNGQVFNKKIVKQ